VPPVGRIRDRSTFAALRRSGRRVRSGSITLFFLPTGDPPFPRVAFTVGRRVGSAVTRNRVRRRLRAIMAEERARLEPGAYLLTTTPETATLTYDEMRSTVSSALAALEGPTRADRRP